MSVPNSFRLITNRDESLRAFRAFKRAFSVDAQVVQGCHVGWSGGTTQADVCWHEENRVWGVLRAAPPQPKRKGGDRFWNCFGISEPRPGASLNITVEINPPHSGENRRTAGVFLRDQRGRVYVGHSGRVGGGRRGIGLQAFREFSDHLAWQWIVTPRGARKIVVFGPLEDGALMERLAPFVNTVAEFKDSVARRR